MRCIIFAAAIFASLVASVSSQPASAGSTADTAKAQAPPAAPIPNTMSSYEFLLGKWQCDTLTPQGKVDYSFTQEISKIMDGHWFKFHNVSGRGNNNVEAFATYDGKAWRFLSISSSGGYSIGRSRGWRGNAQTWTGYYYESGTRRPWGRIVFKKLSDREKRGDFYEPTRNGKSRLAESDVCKKID